MGIVLLRAGPTTATASALTGHCPSSNTPITGICTRVASVNDEGEARVTHESCTGGDDALVGDVSDVGDVPHVALEVYRLTGYVPCRGRRVTMSVPSTTRGGSPQNGRCVITSLTAPQQQNRPDFRTKLTKTTHFSADRYGGVFLRDIATEDEKMSWI